MWGLSYCSKFGVGPNYTIVVVGWGTKSLFKKGATTDQLKTVVPKVPDLANTALFKGKGRIVTGLVGVLMPCLFSRPIMYTVLENMPAGGNMQASILLDVLLEVKKTLGHLPRRVVAIGNCIGQL